MYIGSRSITALSTERKPLKTAVLGFAKRLQRCHMTMKNEIAKGERACGDFLKYHSQIFGRQQMSNTVWKTVENITYLGFKLYM